VTLRWRDGVSPFRVVRVKLEGVGSQDAAEGYDLNTHARKYVSVASLDVMRA